METGLFALGALGALIMVYLAKQEAIPEFRLLFDTTAKEIELREYQGHVAETQREINAVQARLKEEEQLSTDRAQQLGTVLTSCLTEIDMQIARVESLGREIKQGQIFSRGLGFLLYIILGGAFGVLLAGRVKVDGLNGDLPVYFQSIIIGATWTTYLSTVGLKIGQQKANDRIDTLNTDVTKRCNALDKEITSKIIKIIKNADKMTDPAIATDVERTVSECVKNASNSVQSKIDFTKRIVNRDCNGTV